MPKEVKSKDQKVSRKTKAKKDPNAPKKPLSAFMIFSQENRPRIKEENPDATFGDLGKLLGAAWKEINPKDKALYEKKQEKAKQQYEVAIAEYNNGGKSGGVGSDSE
ncbi:putative nonhistone protein 6 [Fimicolochytrium jonesii]|uniref:putative nonhistone protein 6 n=1 Tax=Fimicolochytrium jonesii TaxID=1396493 RepID=UPI0022FE0357|nr:putative nonhistone protein 6 [Fimicolochytrium jonesii]KAI8818951.1 putative nonhistone protein 6 [Fimicolochytrium jonesii]